jgi:hypothetical protein
MCVLSTDRNHVGLTQKVVVDFDEVGIIVGIDDGHRVHGTRGTGFNKETDAGDMVLDTKGAHFGWICTISIAQNQFQFFSRNLHKMYIFMYVGTRINCNSQ